MKCPKCNSYFPVTSSYNTKYGYTRNRKCQECGFSEQYLEVPKKNYETNCWLVEQMQNNIKEFIRLRNIDH